MQSHMEAEWKFELRLQLSTENISHKAAALPSEPLHLKTKPLATNLKQVHQPPCLNLNLNHGRRKSSS